MDQFIESNPKIRVQKKAREASLIQMARNSSGPRKQPTLCCSTDKKRAVPSRNSLLSAVDD
ncbi:hypothetical protein BKC07_14180 [Peribacillus simplex]|nr:hypothetical protein BKC07_14180 [Peribacillus simplex]